jgi:hypothetical protein
VKGALGEVPAYVRRARRTEDAVRGLHLEVGGHREELLAFVCLRLRQYVDAVPGPLPPRIAAIHAEIRETATFAELRPRPARGRKNAPDVAAARLRESVARFNRRFLRWIDDEAPLDRANREIEGYNRYYALERQAALRYVPADQVRFEKRKLLTRDDLLAAFPLLPEP